MIANTAEIKLQVITAKNIAVVSAAILQWLEAKHQHGKMESHLKEIWQGLERRLKNGVKRFSKGIITLANIVRAKHIYKHIISLNGQKMKAKDLMLKTVSHCALIVMARCMERILHIELRKNVFAESKLKEKVTFVGHVQQKTNGKERGQKHEILPSHY